MACAILPIVPLSGTAVLGEAALRRLTSMPTLRWAEVAQAPVQLVVLTIGYLLLAMALLHAVPRTREHLRRHRAWGWIEAARVTRVQPRWRQTVWVEAYVLRRVVFDLLGPGDDA